MRAVQMGYVMIIIIITGLITGTPLVFGKKGESGMALSFRCILIKVFVFVFFCSRKDGQTDV